MVVLGIVAGIIISAINIQSNRKSVWAISFYISHFYHLLHSQLEHNRSCIDSTVDKSDNMVVAICIHQIVMWFPAARETNVNGVPGTHHPNARDHAAAASPTKSDNVRALSKLFRFENGRWINNDELWSVGITIWAYNNMMRSNHLCERIEQSTQTWCTLLMLMKCVFIVRRAVHCVLVEIRNISRATLRYVNIDW